LNTINHSFLLRHSIPSINARSIPASIRLLKITTRKEAGPSAVASAGKSSSSSCRERGRDITLRSSSTSWISQVIHECVELLSLANCIVTRKGFGSRTVK
jgi:hypothetical protein